MGSPRGSCPWRAAHLSERAVLPPRSRCLHRANGSLSYQNTLTNSMDSLDGPGSNQGRLCLEAATSSPTRGPRDTAPRSQGAKAPRKKRRNRRTPEKRGLEENSIENSMRLKDPKALLVVSSGSHCRSRPSAAHVLPRPKR